MHFAGNSAEGTAGTTYMSLRICPKSRHIFPVKVAAALLCCVGKGADGA